MRRALALINSAPRIDRTQKSSGALRASPTERPAFGLVTPSALESLGSRVRVTDTRRPGSKRRRVHSPQPGDSLGTKDAPSRVIRRWKAPRVQPIPVLFAGDRRKRPYEGTHRQSVRAGRARQGPSFYFEGPAAAATPADVATSARQGVSEPIGLGQSSRCERSRWEESNPRRADRPSDRPLARDVSVGRASKHGHPQSVRSP
jgi:hypothetical protein